MPDRTSSISSGLKPWEGAQVIVVEGDQKTQLIHGLTGLHARSAERSTTDILKSVKGQNKKPKPENWRILKRHTSSAIMITNINQPVN